MTTTTFRLFAGIALLLTAAACRQQQLPSAADIEMALTVSDRRVGDSTLLLAVADAAGKPIAEPGALSLRGDMDHAGMVPVFAESNTARDGVFALPFTWTMGGSWTLEATLTLPDGTIARQHFDIEILTEASGDGMDMAQHDAHDAMGGESSAVYLRIHNTSAEDINIVAAESAAAARIAFHQTVIEDDIARMEALAGLRIPAGETVELAPGGAHIMLMDLRRDLPPQSMLPLQLSCDKGETYALEFAVMNQRLGALDDAVTIGELVFSNRWARPASAGMADDGAAHSH